jgi:hypothetical protein
MNKFIMFSFLGCCLFLTTPTLGQAQDNIDRAESTYDEEYKLYDRNEHGLDWNRYNYPESRKHKGYGY